MTGTAWGKDRSGRRNVMANVGRIDERQLCLVRSRGRIELAKSLSAHPTVECEICGLYADEPVNVCSPRQLPGIAWLGDGADNFKGS